MNAIVESVRRFNFVQWLRDIFRAREKPLAPQPEPVIACAESATEDPPPAAAPREAKAQKSRPNLKRILEELDKTWANLGRATKGLDHIPTLSARDLDGLKRIGPLVLPGNSLPFVTDVAAFTTNNAELPMTMFIAINDGESTSSESHAPDFFYAIKIRKAPWNVAKKPGQAFQLGMGWRSSNGSVMWGQFYAYVNGGRVYPAHWLCNQSVPVPGGSYSKRVWDVSTWTTRLGSRAVEIVFSNAIAAYQARLDSWNVSVTKGGRRATFLIDKADTAYAFKDRNGTALAADGKRKRIIHFVQAHQQRRANGLVVEVPAHIRGLREFDWNGFHCFVTSPQHHTHSSALMTLAGDDVPEEELISGDQIDLAQVATMLVAAEDENNQRKKKAA